MSCLCGKHTLLSAQFILQACDRHHSSGAMTPARATLFGTTVMHEVPYTRAALCLFSMHRDAEPESSPSMVCARSHTPLGCHRPRMKNCLICHIVLDLPCPNPVCPGHQNASIGDLCRYCATNQRDAALHNDEKLDLFVSSVGEMESERHTL